MRTCGCAWPRRDESCRHSGRERAMYVCGLVIPLPEGQMEAYRRWAENGAAFFRDYGCLEIVESWEDYVPDGKSTDFRKAVAAQPGEKIVFVWQVWPDKEMFQD